MGYSISNGERVTYSIGSEKVNYSMGSEKANYSIGNGTVAHEMAAIAPKTEIVAKIVPPYSISSTAQPYSFSVGGITKYTTGVEARETPVALGSQKTMTTVALGMGLKTENEAAPEPAPIETALPPVVNETKNETAAASAPVINETENVTAATAAPAPVVVKLSIKGMVKDENETGLAGWKIDLSTTDLKAIANTTSAENGSFSFADLAAGDYVVSEVLSADWVAVSPANGVANVTLTDMDVTLDFVNKINATMAAPAAEVAPAAAGNETNTTGM